MNDRKMGYLPAALLAAAVGVIAAGSGGCSAASSLQEASQGCSGLDTKTSTAQATVKAWVDSLTALQAAADGVQKEWLTVCNAMNGDLGLDTTKTNASDACGVLNTYIQAGVSASVTLTLTVSPPSCQADVSVQASCEADCTASASCDVTAHCTGGDVVVGCNGSCSGQCDVTAPSVACMGECKGSCTASAAVSCMGECSGSCTAPMWTGTCDAGCTASFTGSCGGNCNGTCDGNSMSGGACKGKCVGSCDAKASGSCQAMCTGQFSGGQCMGMCTGSCNVSAGASCSGMCNGTCSYTPGMATCMGECHGSCSAQVSPPTCTGTLDCMASATCHGDCQAQAQAKLDCSPPQVSFDIEGDSALYSTFQNHLADIGKAINDTTELSSLILGTNGIAAQTESVFSAIGDIGAAGIACVGSQVQAVGNIKASVTVSVSASATVSGHGSGSSSSM
jgi:hypothetical protein